MTEYILKKNEDSIIIKTTLEESKLLEIIKQAEEHENYSQAYFVEVIEYIEEELDNLSCSYQMIDPEDLTIVAMK